MATEIKEYNKLIAERVPPGDRWTLLQDDNDVVFGSLTDCLNEIFIVHQATQFFVDAKKGDLNYFDFSKGRYELIIHGGAPDMTDPINWWFNRMIKFYENYTKLEKFTSPTGYVNGAKMYIIGAYQQLDCLDHIWPIDTVVSFEDIIEHHKNNKGNLGQVIDTSIKVKIPFESNMMKDFTDKLAA